MNCPTGLASVLPALVDNATRCDGLSGVVRHLCWRPKLCSGSSHWFCAVRVCLVVRLVYSTHRISPMHPALHCIRHQRLSFWAYSDTWCAVGQMATRHITAATRCVSSASSRGTTEFSYLPVKYNFTVGPSRVYFLLLIGGWFCYDASSLLLVLYLNTCLFSVCV